MTKKILQKLENHDKILESHGRMLESHSKQLDLIVSKVLEHDDWLQRIEETMATKQDIRSLVDSIDKLLGLVRKHDQELVFMGERVKRNEEQTIQNTKDIQRINLVVF